MSKKLHMTWVAHRAVLDRSMACWATRRLAPFLTVPAIVPPIGTSIAPVVGGGGGFVGPPYEARETKVFSPLKHEAYYLRSIPLVHFDFLVEEILAFHRNVIRFV
jgi:hypothetical protein